MSILGRHLVRTWTATFSTSMIASSAIYVVIDIFNRVGEVLPFSPPWTSLISYFLFKMPKILFDVFPAACLLATMMAIGTLAKNREILAMRACGMSTARIATPILGVALLLCFGALLWSENVVPVAATRSRWLWDVDLKQKAYRGVFDAASLWFQNDRGFVYIRRYDAGARVISGLTLFEADSSFGLRRVFEVGSMEWKDGRWVSSGGFVKDVAADDLSVRPLAAAEFELHEDPENLATRRRQPEEFSFSQLRHQITQLQARGLAADEPRVDLHRKMAWPFAGFFVTLLALPLALGANPDAGRGRTTATGLAIGFGYWILTGLALSAGRSGAVSPVLAAWTANAACCVAAAVISLRSGSR